MVINMPLKKQDAYRALELLEDYYNRLDKPEDKQLKNAIDRVIKVFKCRLFQALIEIQEFYESILLDDHRDLHSKMDATLLFADAWEKKLKIDENENNKHGTKTPPLLPPAGPRESNGKKIIKDPQQPIPTQIVAVTHPPDITQFNYADHWIEEEIYLERSTGVGLGFSIAGGNDISCIADLPYVVVTRITDNGIAAKDDRLRLHDIILRVNEIDFTDIHHTEAVDALKHAGNKHIRRVVPPDQEEIELHKPPNTTLGFSIAGGISHPHVKGDHGIFITNIIHGGITDQNGRLRDSEYDLQFVEHKNAVESIRLACSESDIIKLLVGHPSRAMNPNGHSISINGQMHHEQRINEDDPEAERQIVLRRGQNGFGFNFVAGDVDEGIFVSSIHSGGSADKNGNLKKGDRILSVNQIDLRSASHEQASNVLKNCGNTANMVVAYKLDGSTGSLKTSTKRDFFVRAEFKYNPTKDSALPNANSGLPFNAGDILHVTNAADDQWWRANRVQYDGIEEDSGIIPSKKRVEKRERSRQRKVIFNQSKSKNNTLDRDKSKKKKKFGLFGKGGDRKENQSGDDTDNEPDNPESVSSYVLVEPQR
ncbi:unnamed protein product, partial [Didymodactylos carnosus]